MSSIKGKLGKRGGGGPKRGKKGAAPEAADKKKAAADPKKPKQKVQLSASFMQTQASVQAPRSSTVTADVWVWRSVLPITGIR